MSFSQRWFLAPHSLILFSVFVTNSLRPLLAWSASTFLEKEASTIVDKLKPSLKTSDRIAVMNLAEVDGQTSRLGNYLTGLISAQMANRRYRVVERQNLESLLTEMKLQRSGAIDSEVLLKVGKMAGANVLLMGTVVGLAKPGSIRDWRRFATLA